ncbi:MAG: AEC family transporter [Clostridia bacterium]|nr:AEC family transporter [Clostridia bacterium]
MINVFLYAANAVLPIVLLIGLGYFLRRRNFYDEKFLKTANKLGFRVVLPMLLFYNVYKIDSLSSINWSTVLYAVATILVLFAVGLIAVIAFCKNDRQKGVLLQSSFRSNFAIIGIPLAQALGGDETLAVVSVLSAFSIALFNVLAVISLTVFIKDGENSRPSVKSILIKICKNPLIIAILLGLACLVLRSLLPQSSNGEPVFTIRNQLPFLYSAIETAAKMASPLMLIVLGGQFSFEAIGALKKQIAMGTFMRIVLAPVIGVGGAILLNGLGLFSFTANDYAAFIALFGSPIAVSSAVMAAEMHNDEQLAGQLVVWTSIGSVLTIFISAVILKSVNLL